MTTRKTIFIYTDTPYYRPDQARNAHTVDAHTLMMEADEVDISFLRQDSHVNTIVPRHRPYTPGLRMG